MINDLKIFDYNGSNVRTVLKNNETWFVLKDVCDVLELNSIGKVAERLDEDEKHIFKDESNSLLNIPNRGLTIINESGLYNVILRSDKPEAKKFKKWVTSEVLPNIRKHGLYATEDVVRLSLENPSYMIELLTNYQKEQNERKKSEKLLEQKTIELDESKEWFSIKRMATLNNKYWTFYKWRNLKNASEYLGYAPRKVFDANYGEVNAYHINVWKHEYGNLKIN